MRRGPGLGGAPVGRVGAGGPCKGDGSEGLSPPTCTTGPGMSAGVLAAVLPPEGGAEALSPALQARVRLGRGRPERLHPGGGVRNSVIC